MTEIYFCINRTCYASGKGQGREQRAGNGVAVWVVAGTTPGSQSNKQPKRNGLESERVGGDFFVKVLLITTDNDPRCVILRLDLVHSLKLAHEGANARRNSQEKNPSESREPVQVRHLSIHRGPPLGSVRTLKGFSNFFLQSLCTLLLANLKGLGHLFMVTAASICAA